MISRKSILAVSCCGLIALGVAACGSSDDSTTAAGGGGDLSGTIRVDGSSTVGPLTEALAEQFQQSNPGVKVTVGTSGTGGGFEKFCAGETDISDASRPIEPEEAKICKSKGIDYEEVRVATDALTVVVNPNNPVDCMTVDQISQIYAPGSKVDNWSQISGLKPAFDHELTPYGVGTSSGTFDYFTEAINGEEGASRKDYNNVGEDDNATVTGVSGDEGAIGYFGFSYYQENQDKVKALEVDGGDGCVAPSAETAQNDEYVPLSRPLFIYPTSSALADNPAVEPFIDYYLENVNSLAESVGYIPLTDKQLSESQASWDKIKSSAG